MRLPGGTAVTETCCRVLLITRDMVEAATVEKALAPAGIACERVADTAAALKVIAGGEYDAVLLGGSGETSEAIAFLKGSPARLPLILLSDPGSGPSQAEVVKYKLLGVLTHAGSLEKNPGTTVENVLQRLGEQRSGRLGARLREEIGKLAYFADDFTDPLLLIDRNGQIGYVNRAFEGKYLFRQGELTGADISRVLASPSDRARLLEAARAGGARGSAAEVATLTKQGRRLLSQVAITPRRDGSGEAFAHLLLLRDITASRDAETSMQRQLSVLTSPEVALAAPDFREVVRGPEIQKLQDVMSAAFGVSSLIVSPEGTPLNRGSNYTRLCACIADSKGSLADGCRSCLADLAGRVTAEAGAHCVCPLTGMIEAAVPLSSDGQLLACWIVGQVVVGGEADHSRLGELLRGAGVPASRINGLLSGKLRITATQFNQIVQTYGIVSDKVAKLAIQNLRQGKYIHERDLVLEELRQSQLKLQEMSYRDGLTGLYNRAFFEREMERLSAETGRSPVSFVAVDVDGLKLINDTLGHAAGDQHIKATGRLLGEVFADAGTVCRIGGDEFCALLPGCDERQASLKVEQLWQAIQRHNGSRSGSPVHMSTGCATAKADESAYSAYKRADGLMYQNKTRQDEYTRAKSIDRILLALSERDYVDHGHTRALTTIVEAMARAAGLGEEARNNLVLLARLHDLGKLGVPDSIVLKPGPLDESEWVLMRSHVETGANLASRSSLASPIAPLIRHHHERYDGKGYPSGLAGDQIPVECRILAIADAFDAMIADRPYRKGLSREAALEEIRSGSGSQFDPQLAETFLRLAREGQV